MKMGCHKYESGTRHFCITLLQLALLITYIIYYLFLYYYIINHYIQIL